MKRNISYKFHNPVAAIVLVLIALLFSGGPAQAGNFQCEKRDGAAAMANPASTNCINEGGTLAIEKRGDGGEYGVCTFADNRQCEEWAFFRGECPFGGRKITGYVTPASRYCVITGGYYEVTASSNTDQEQGTCSFKNGKACDAIAYYSGKCSRAAE